MELHPRNRIPERSVLNMALPVVSLPCTKHDQLLVYGLETFLRKMNFNLNPHLIDIAFNSNYEIECLPEEVSFERTF